MSKRKRSSNIVLLAMACTGVAACDNVPTGTVQREVFGGATASEAQAECEKRYGNASLCEMMPAEKAEQTRTAGSSYVRPFYSYGPSFNSHGIIMPGGARQPLPTAPSSAVGVKSFDMVTKAPVSIAPTKGGASVGFSGTPTRGGFGGTGGAHGGSSAS